MQQTLFSHTLLTMRHLPPGHVSCAKRSFTTKIKKKSANWALGVSFKEAQTFLRKTSMLERQAATLSLFVVLKMQRLKKFLDFFLDSDSPLAIERFFFKTLSDAKVTLLEIIRSRNRVITLVLERL